MTSYKARYQQLFQRLGYPLTNGTKCPASDIAAAEKRLGIRLPAALRDFYLVAGRERRLNQALNRLLPPKSLKLDRKNLIFMTENQSVAAWSVSLRSKQATDPPAFQGVNNERITWVREHRRVSVFLEVMLHYHAVMEVYAHQGSVECPDDVHLKLKKQRWKFFGEVNNVWAFGRQNQVVCVTLGAGLPFMPDVMLHAGGKTKQDLQAIEESLELKFKK